MTVTIGTSQTSQFKGDRGAARQSNSPLPSYKTRTAASDLKEQCILHKCNWIEAGRGYFSQLIENMINGETGLIKRCAVQISRANPPTFLLPVYGDGGAAFWQVLHHQP